MIICGFDLETTGLDANLEEITEVGAVLWDTELNAPVRFFNRLLKISKPVPPEIVRLTGITDQLLQKYGEEPHKVWLDFKEFIASADYLMAHNAPFDKGFVEKPCGELGKQYIDSSVDIEYPEHIQTRKLVHLAAEHYFVNPFAHRAVTDVLTMMQIASKYDWKQTVQSALTPNVTIRAMVTYEQNQKAKSNGFRWDAARKFWIKQIKENRLAEETEKYLNQGFVVKKVG